MGTFCVGRRQYYLACTIDRFHFSAHSNRQDLLALIEGVNPRTLLLVHGDRDAADWMESAVKTRNPNVSVVRPERGEEVELA